MAFCFTNPAHAKEAANISEIKMQIKILVETQRLQYPLIQLQEGKLVGLPLALRFENNLKYGTASIEVKYLQIMLNAIPETMVPDFQSTINRNIF